MNDSMRPRLPQRRAGSRILFVSFVAIFHLQLLLSPPVLFAGGASEQPRDESERTPSEQTDGGAGRIPILFLFSVDDIDTPHARILERSAAATLSAQDPQVLFVHPPESDDSSSRSDAPSESPRILAHRADALGWLEIHLSAMESADPGIEVSLQLHGVSRPDPFADTAYIAPTDGGAPNYRRIWREAGAAFSNGVEELRESLERGEHTTQLRVQGVPGTTILGLGDEIQSLDDSGTLTLTVPDPAVYSLEARAPLHRPVERTIKVSGNNREIVLEQEKRGAFSVDFALEQLAFPAIDVNRRIWGDYFFARLGLTTYLLGVTPFEEARHAPRSEPRRYFSSDPLTVFRAGVGSYIQPPYGTARTYMAAGALWRQVHARGNFGGDPVASWGIPLSLGIESHPQGTSKLFFEWHPTLYVSDYPELAADAMPGAVILGSSADNGADFIPDPISGRSPVLSLAAFRVGLRRQP